MHKRLVKMTLLLLAGGGIVFLLLCLLAGILYVAGVRPRLFTLLAAPTVTPGVPPPTVLLLDSDVARLPVNVTGQLLLRTIPVNLSQLAAAGGDAILISKATLLDASKDSTLRTALLGVVRSGKALLVYGASTSDLRDNLGLDLPFMQTQQTRYVVASLGQQKDGNYIVGGVLVSKGVSDLEVDIVQDMYEQVQRYRQTILFGDQ